MQIPEVTSMFRTFSRSISVYVTWFNVFSTGHCYHADLNLTTGQFMDFKPLNLLSPNDYAPLLQGIPFYKTVRDQDPQQYATLLQNSQLGCFGPGDTLLAEGDYDFWLYFLLRGQLDVFPGCSERQEAINQVTPGEVFGDLSMLTGRRRSATIKADLNSKQTTVLGLDFRVFGAVADFSSLTLETKLVYYRNSAHNLRWKLEVYRMKNPKSELAVQHRALKLFSGKRGSFEELLSLEQEAKALAVLLTAWNSPREAQRAPVAAVR